ncbi:MAG: family 10 glycosylhydrolase [Candidatus Omnitrophica bacterium]|nr:family 10 glycosylhydrolase [Candidatus Omnitrophota bacterium]
MRLLFFVLVFILFALSGVGRASETAVERGLFVSVLEQPTVLSDRQAITDLVSFSKKNNVKILFVQVYRANKAWFPSSIADSSPYRLYLQSLGEDPFAFLIRQAHQEGIEVHAWLNMLSLAENKDAPVLKKYGPSILTKNLTPKRTLDDYKIDNQFFLEPSDKRVQKELLLIVREVLHAYPGLDGIQFDYIRYPDTAPHYGYSSDNIQRFKKAMGVKTIDDKSKAWHDWKRRQVTDFLRALVKETRALRPKIHISTTGCMSYIRAYEEAFQDWPNWVRSGLAEFVTIMSYPDTAEDFQKSILDAQKRVMDFSKIKIAIPAYKAVIAPHIFKEELDSCLTSGSGGCIIFYYGILKANPSLENYFTPSQEKTRELNRP